MISIKKISLPLVNDLFYSTIQFAFAGLYPLVIIIFLSSRFSIEVWGELTLIQTTAALMFIGVNYGTDSFGIREISKTNDFNKITQLIKQIYKIRIINFVVLFLISVIPLYTIYSDISIFIYILVLANLLSPLWIFIGIKKIKKVVLIEIIIRILFVLLLFKLVKGDDDKEVYILVLALNLLAVNAITLFILINYLKSFHFKSYNIYKLLDLYKKVFPFLTTQLSYQLYTTLPIIIIGFNLGKESAAIYGNVEKFQRLFRALIYPVGRILLSYSSKSTKVDYFKFWPIVIIISLSVTCSAIFLTSTIVPIFFDDEYHSMKMISSILYISLPFIYLTSHFVNTFIYPKDLEKSYNRILIFITISSLLLIILFTKYVNLIGVSIISLSTEILLSFFLLILIKRKTKCYA